MSDERDNVKVEVIPIESLQPDPNNANAGTERGYYMLTDSIQERGVGRGILASQEGVILAGNKTHQAAIDTGIQEVLLVHTTGDQLVVTVRDDLEADSPEARRMALEDNRIGQVSLEFDPAVLLEMGKKDDTIFDGLFRDDEFEELLTGLMEDETQNEIGGGGRLYDDHDIEPYKLAHRVEAAWQAPDGIAVDLFSGAGELASWYKRRFERVVTVDEDVNHRVDYVMTASKFIQIHLSEFLDSFSFIDFDDEGTPAREIWEFFSHIAGKRTKPFVLALTDGNGLNLKFRGRYNPSMYLAGGDVVRQATRKDYDDFERTVMQFIPACAEEFGFGARNISSYRGRRGNVVCQTWFIRARVAT